MKKILMILLMMYLPVTTLAAEKSDIDPEDHDLPADYHETHPGAKPGQKIRKYADDAQTGAQENFGVQPVHDNEIFAVFRGDRLEYRTGEGDDSLLWDVQAWIGSDYHKLYLESEGNRLIDEDKIEEAEIELLYGRNIASFWDLRAGIRHDFKPEPSRTFAALGVQGLAPYWFETEATVYLSEDGDISAGLEFEYDLLLSQRLILQPRLETSLALQEVQELNIGSGINDIELGLRLRYEIRREFAPYIGASLSRKLFETADLVEEDGEDIETFSLVIGIKFWF